MPDFSEDSTEPQSKDLADFFKDTRIQKILHPAIRFHVLAKSEAG